MKWMFVGVLLFFTLTLRAVSAQPELFSTKPLPPKPPQLSRTEPLLLKTVDVYPHDNKAFTQGLVFDNGFLYESTGNYGG
jgi:glutamine cyclotransferase